MFKYGKIQILEMTKNGRLLQMEIVFISNLKQAAFVLLLMEALLVEQMLWSKVQMAATPKTGFLSLGQEHNRPVLARLYRMETI